MDSQKDYYAILGVLPTADLFVIRAVYKALIQRYHPDKYHGSPEEGNRITTEINEAYAVLSDPVKRKEYDDLRGTGAQYSDEFFEDGIDDIPDFDPRERDWEVALEFYPDLIEIEQLLSKISWKLAYGYRVILLETKEFDQRKGVAALLENGFLELYFGTDPHILRFAKELIYSGNKQAAKSLNRAIKVLGSSTDDPYRIIRKIRNQYKLPWFT
jgi:curved DNA-binding protein CbpA